MPRSTSPGGKPYKVLNLKMATDPAHEGQVWFNWEWWDPNWTPNLEKWEIYPNYSYVDTDGKLRWQNMAAETLENVYPAAQEWNFYWDLPVNAEEVNFRYRPIAKNQKDGTPYWEEEVLTTETVYFGGATKPDKPNSPTVTRQSTLGIQVVLSLTNVTEPENNKNVVKAEFQTIQYNSQFDSGTILNTINGYVDEWGNIQAFTTIGTAYGYKFRARLWASKDSINSDKTTVVSSDWSDLTEEFVTGVPEQPKLTVSKFSSTQVEYEVGTNYEPPDPESHEINAHHFQFEVAPSVTVFNDVDEWERQNPSLKENSEARTAAIASFGIIDEFTAPSAPKKFQRNVNSVGQDFAVYRVRAVSAETDGYYSPWSDPCELRFSDGLRAPIVWSATKFAEVGDQSMKLYVMHNSPNGSPSCRCVIFWSINKPQPWQMIILDPPSGQTNSTVYQFDLDISSFTEQTTIYWFARTYEGVPIEANISPASEQMDFVINDKPTIELLFPEIPANEIINGMPVVASLPLKYVTQTTYFDSEVNPVEIISYEFNIISAQSYRHYDKQGRLQVVREGDVIYHLIDTSKYYDDARYLTASDVTLEDGMNYYFQVTVALSNGSTGTNAKYEDEEYIPGKPFTVKMEGASYIIECTHNTDKDTIALYLNPSAVKYEGGGFGMAYPDMDFINTNNENAFKYDETINRLLCSSVRPNGQSSSSDGYIFYIDGYDSDGHLPHSITEFFAAQNNMTVSEFSQFCKDNALWIFCSKVKSSLSRSDGYYEDSDGDYMPSVEILATDKSHSNSGMNNIPLLDHTYSSYEEQEYVVGQEYECTYETESEFGLDFIRMSALGVNSYRTSYTGEEWFGDYPIVEDSMVGILFTNPEYFGDSDDCVSMGFEFSLGQSLMITEAIAELEPDFAPYIGQFYRDACLEMGGECELVGTVYENPNMVTTVSVPYGGNQGDPRRVYVNNVDLAVYRKNDDGTFVTIEENIPNTEALFITDPHPNLGGAEYRIVATDRITGKMTYYDPPPIDMGCTDIILQWDEDYANKPNNGDIRETIPQLGNIVRLPYNIDVSESANLDSEMVKYIGRRDPVSYYGTQTGYTATWNTEIPKYDKDTIKMLRKLQVYPGDVYVREPNGTGYWANVKVTFPINHLALTVSVSLSITRVEGGK